MLRGATIIRITHHNQKPMTLSEPIFIAGSSGQPSMTRSAGELSSFTGVPSPVYVMDYFLSLDAEEEQRYKSVKKFVKDVFSAQFSDSPLSSHGSSDEHQLEISPLTGGITNMLLQGTYCRKSSGDKLTFLIRTYGNGTDTIIDRDREFATHMTLQSLDLAPALYARFGNGLIYEYLPGKPLDYIHMSDISVMKAVANRLAQWHSKIQASAIDKRVSLLKNNQSSTFAKDIWELMSHWIDILPAGIVGMTGEELRNELQWIRNTIGDASPTAVCHSDLLSGNILVPETFQFSEPVERAQQDPTLLRYSLSDSTSTESYSLSHLVNFIDYEYTMPAPRSFDLANHFMEWQGFDCKVELIPELKLSNPVLRYWAFHYLSAEASFKESRPPAESDIDSLILEIASWWGMPGFYWGIWSAIQSTISDIDFDYADYAGKRLGEYKQWKQVIYPRLGSDFSS